VGLVGTPSRAPLERVVKPPTTAALPAFDRGWLVAPDSREAFLHYSSDASANWSDELEQLHDDQARLHFIDVATRRAMLAVVDQADASATIVDLGCSSGYLLEELRAAHPDATLLGIDLVASGLRRAHAAVPDAVLLQADATALPLVDSTIEFVVSANLLEHVEDDVSVLREVARILRPGGTAIFVVPASPGLYDYYDRFLGHVRRYAHGELPRKAHAAGLTVERVSYVGALLYPMFWLVKKRNRRFLADLECEALERRVAADIAGTTDSRVGRLAMRLEQRLQAMGVPLPFGVRCMAVVRRPGRGA
jgi:SAM-dependent methyltransferase